MARRERGTGTVFKRKDRDKWTGKLDIGRDEKGNRKYTYFSGDTESEVKKAIREYIKKSDIAENGGGKSVVMQDYALEWLHTFKRVSLKPSSYDRLESTILTHVNPSIGYIQLNQVTSDDIQEMINNMVSDGKSYSTVKKAHDAVNAIMTHAMKKEDIERNPMLNVTLPRKGTMDSKDIVYFTEKEFAAIVEEARRRYQTSENPVYSYGEAYVLALNTGMRAGEILGLKLEDVDFENRRIHIRRNVQRIKSRDEEGNVSGGYQIVEATTKTYSGDRVIDLNDDAVLAVSRLVARHKDCEYIVCNREYKVLPITNYARTFNRILKNCNMKPTGTHAMRHTFASILFHKGVDIKTISYLLGHASVSITYNTYIHLINESHADAVKKLDVASY